MIANATFDELLDAVELLPAEAQADLIEVVRRRLALQGRQQIKDDTVDARREHALGGTRPSTVDELMDEIDA